MYFASVLANSPLRNVSGPVRGEVDVKIADDQMLRRSIGTLLRSVTTELDEVGSSSVSAAACREGCGRRLLERDHESIAKPWLVSPNR